MVAKLAKACTLRISPEKLNFMVSDKVANRDVSMCCELDQMEVVSAENSKIYLGLTAENLSQALKTAQNTRALKVKLTNKHFPCQGFPRPDIVSNKIVHFDLLHEDVSLQHFIPASS